MDRSEMKSLNANKSAVRDGACFLGGRDFSQDFYAASFDFKPSACNLPDSFEAWESTASIHHVGFVGAIEHRWPYYIAYKETADTLVMFMRATQETSRASLGPTRWIQLRIISDARNPNRASGFPQTRSRSDSSSFSHNLDKTRSRLLQRTSPSHNRGMARRRTDISSRITTSFNLGSAVLHVSTGALSGFSVYCQVVEWEQPRAAICLWNATVSTTCIDANRCSHKVCTFQVLPFCKHLT